MANFDELAPQTRRIGRYEVLGEIASGGMATVFLAKSMGAKGFSRLVAIKRLHPHLEGEEEFVQMFLDEARLAARIRHPHVVATLDVEDAEGLYIVMEYIEGVTLLTLSRSAQKAGEKIPVPVVARIALDILGGLQAAHDLIDDNGEFLNLVHRDVSPQNILLGTDGAARLTDFGIAKAGSRLTQTRDGQLKGKISYMAPEQTRRQEIDRRVDLFTMGICVWELLAGRRLFQGDSDVEVLNHLLFEPIPRLRDVAPSVPASLEQVVMKALERDPNNRYKSAYDFADAIERATKVLGGPGNHRTVAAYLQKICGERIQRERGRIANGLPPTSDSASTGSFKAIELPQAPPVARPPAPDASPAMPPPGQRFRAPTLAGAPLHLQPQLQPQRPAATTPPRAASPTPTKLPLRGAPTAFPSARPNRATVMGMGPETLPPTAPVVAHNDREFDVGVATIAAPSAMAGRGSWEQNNEGPTAPEFDPMAVSEATIVESAPIEAIIERLRLNGGKPIEPARAPVVEFESDDDIEEIAPEPSGAFHGGHFADLAQAAQSPVPQSFPLGRSPMINSAPTPSFAPLPTAQGPGLVGQYGTQVSPFGPLAGPPQQWSLGVPVQSALPIAGHPAPRGNERRSKVLAFALGMVIVAIFGGVAFAWTLRRNQASSSPAVIPHARPAVPPPVPATAPGTVLFAPPPRVPAPVAQPVAVAQPIPVAEPVPVAEPLAEPAADPRPHVHRRRHSRRGDETATDSLAPFAASPIAPTRVLPAPTHNAPDPDALDLGNPYRH